MHEVRDGSRTLRFHGDLLAQSSSQRPGASRWVEFELYRTVSGSYVLSRVGVSSFFHHPDCSVVSRNGLREGEINKDSVPCDECRPDPTGPVCVERPRYWAQVSETPEAVLEALYKYDDAGTRYLTTVAKNLVERAGTVDPKIDDAYRIEHVR